MIDTLDRWNVGAVDVADRDRLFTHPNWREILRSAEEAEVSVMDVMRGLSSR